jgi:hypothetical protein
LETLFGGNSSTNFYNAINVNLNYQFLRSTIGIGYERIDPQYATLGAYFFNNDLEVFTVNANAGLLNNKLMLRGSLGTQRDNLGKTKKATSARTVGSFAATYNYNQNFGVDANYSNFSTNQRAGRSAIIDSLKLYQVNSNFSIMPRFSKVTAANSHFVMLNLSWMQLDDKNKRTAEQNATKTSVAALNYSLGLLKTRTNLIFGLNSTSLQNNMYEGKMFSGSLGAAQSLFKDKLSLNWTNSLMSNKMAGTDGSTFNSYLSASFRPHPQHAFNLSFNYISNKYSNKDIEDSTSSKSNETRGEIRYAYTF